MKKRIFLSPPDMGGSELDHVVEAFRSNYIAPIGPQVDAFEKEFSDYTGIRYCVALSSGTAAMHLALKGLGVGLGDEVWFATLTFIGSVSPATFMGATPVFIDCDRMSWNMDAELLAEALERAQEAGQLPKAVVPTDLYGQCGDSERLIELCDNFGVPLVVDAAEAMGARYLGRNGRLGASGQGVHAGKGSRAAIFSFNGNKIMTTSGGGMLASDDAGLIEYARFLSQQAREPCSHYEHREIGYNYRMSNILAAIGRGQLVVLDERVARKREIFDYYQARLSGIPGIEFMPEADYGRANRWLTVILIHPEKFGSNRETVRQALERENIESRPVWKPMHLQPVFTGTTSRPKSGTMRKDQSYPCRVIGGDVAESLFRCGICLPSGTALTEADLDRIIGIILDCRG